MSAVSKFRPLIKEKDLRVRWFFYVLIGLVFGVLDWYYLDILRSALEFVGRQGNMENAPLLLRLLAVTGIVVLNWGFWLVPVIPASIYESKRSKPVGLSALAAVLVWCFAILSYYVYYTVLLLFWGLPGMDFMLFSNRNTVTYWVNWKPAFQNLILDQFSEWVGIALIGGAIVGALTCISYRFYQKRISSPAGLPG